MKRTVVATNATARAFQVAALSLVGACVLFVLVDDVGRRQASGGAPPEKAGMGPGTLTEYSGLMLAGSERYSAEKCGGTMSAMRLAHGRPSQACKPIRRSWE